MARPAIPVPGQKHAHDDFEEIVVEVMRQEHLANTSTRLDAEIERDESRARRQAAPAPTAASKSPTPPSSDRSKPRPEHLRPSARLRHQRARKANEQSPQASAINAAGIIVLLAAGLSLAVAGGLFTIIVKLVRVMV
jgi:hypothetical protein